MLKAEGCRTGEPHSNHSLLCISFVSFASFVVKVFFSDTYYGLALIR